MRIARVVLGLSFGSLLILHAGAVSAQSSAPQAGVSQTPASSDPLAAAAKRTREDKKDQAKPAHVWDNDTIPKAGHEISVVGQSGTVASDGTTDGTAPDGSANGTAAATAPAPSAPAPNPAAEDARIQSQLTNAKEKLASLKTDLELMQRTFTLDSQMYYGKPDYSSDRGGARKLTDEQANIASKQQAIEETEKQVADLETQLKNSAAQNNPPVNNHD